MFVGHFAIAFVLILLFPQVPSWIPLVGVSFPDLLWSLLVWARKEEVVIDKNTSLQRAIVFKSFPYSHSLVLTNVLSLVVGSALAGVTQNLTVIPVFAIASASHWVLDVVVHLPDLPILGFDGDRKVGFGLWKWGKTAFLVELFLFIAFAVGFVPHSSIPVVLLVGIIFHGVNANSFIGSNRKNPFGSPNLYAAAALTGFAAMCALYSFIF